MKASTRPLAFIDMEYDKYAQEYLRSLPLEHFMESTSQGTQREITVASLALVKAKRSDFHVFNELLVQYPRPRKRKPGQVVPDNMVVLSEKRIKAVGSFNLPVEAAGPYWVMEYVSKHNKRKDYEDSFKKYERDLKVPYYLVFYPETQDLTLYRHTGRKYVSVPPDEQGRYPIPELEIELEMLDGWVRYRYKGKLLPLPAELQDGLDQANQRADQANQRADQADQRIRELERLLEEERQARLAAEQKPTPPGGPSERRPRRNGAG